MELYTSGELDSSLRTMTNEQKLKEMMHKIFT